MIACTIEVFPTALSPSTTILEALKLSNINDQKVLLPTWHNEWGHAHPPLQGWSERKVGQQPFLHFQQCFPDQQIRTMTIPFSSVRYVFLLKSPKNSQHFCRLLNTLMQPLTPIIISVISVLIKYQVSTFWRLCTCSFWDDFLMPSFPLFICCWKFVVPKYLFNY